jgi:hypothetical protein
VGGRHHVEGAAVVTDRLHEDDIEAIAEQIAAAIGPLVRAKRARSPRPPKGRARPWRDLVELSWSDGAVCGPGVYLLCQGTTVVYVGRSIDVAIRVDQHSYSEKPRDRVRSLGVCVPEAVPGWSRFGVLRWALAELEWLLIDHLKPRFNARNDGCHPERAAYWRGRGELADLLAEGRP